MCFRKAFRFRKKKFPPSPSQLSSKGVRIGAMAQSSTEREILINNAKEKDTKSRAYLKGVYALQKRSTFDWVARSM